MNYFRKYLKITLILFTLVVSMRAFSATTPLFNTLSAVNVTESEAYLRGEFNAYDTSITKPFYLWFQYGKTPQQLFERTREVSIREKNSIQSYNIGDLEPNTQYYYRTALKDGSDIRYGHVFEFITLEQSIENVESNTNSGEVLNHKPFSFYNIFKWRSKKNTESEPVESTDENEPSVIETNLDENNEDSVDQEKYYNNSAAHNDELGEVIEFNKKYTKNNFKKTGQQRTLNYPILLFFILLLGAILMFAHFLLSKKKKKINQTYRNQGQTDASKGRYYIPVKRDLHDPKQNPNKAFFRNPPKK